MEKKLAIFDMDGTILNTLEDLTDSTNYALRSCQMPEHTIDEVRQYVGNGIRKLIERAVPEGTSEAECDHVFDVFMKHYEVHCYDKTRPYPGIMEFMRELKKKGCLLAVVSNKADEAVQILCERFFDGIFDCAMGERAGVPKKPAPDSVLNTMKELGISKEESIYIGDSDVDLATACNSGLEHVIVTWGFRDRPFLEEKGAVNFADTPEEILPFIVGKHKRRPRYSGTHPRHFSEKYKELNPEKYADTIEKVMKKGSTPAGMHISIMVQEILDFLQIRPGQRGLDATLGYGGHTRAMLEKLEGKGHITALDVDPIESVKTKERLQKAGFGEDILTIRHMNFANVDEAGQEDGPFDFVLADLGVSSMQIDNPERGFSYKTDGPLDLRMNPQKGQSAAERLQELTEEELAGLLWENSDEPYAEEIAAKVIETFQKGGRIEKTGDFRQVIEQALAFLPEKERKDAVTKSCKRCFQALRIDVNSEFEVLYDFLQKLPQTLAPGARVAILTFHSGEDRMVKKVFKQMKKEGIYSDVARDVIRPSADECVRNPRSRSTKMRWAIRV